jgi:chromosome segregation ATPase
MNGEEILRAIGSLETTLEHQSEQLGQLCEFKDELIKTRQEFNDYKEGRKDLPEKISILSGRLDLMDVNYCNLKKLAESTAEEVGTLKRWANQASGIQLAISAAILVFVILTPFILWWLK